MKYLGINLTKSVQDRYKENYKILLKNNKKRSTKWRDIPRSWIGRVIIVKMSVHPNLTYSFSKIPVKIPASYFVNINKV